MVVVGWKDKTTMYCPKLPCRGWVQAFVFLLHCTLEHKIVNARMLLINIVCIMYYLCKLFVSHFTHTTTRRETSFFFEGI